MSAKKPYVFISYSHSDAGPATTFSTRLARAGIPHFRDTEAIEWGESIPERVHDALERATHLVVLISPGSEQSQWVAYEMGYARGRGVTLIPYLLHPKMQVPGFVANIRYVQTRSDEIKFIASLKTMLSKAAKIGKTPTVDHSARRSKPGSGGVLKEGLKQIRSEHPQVQQDGLDSLVELKASTELMGLLGHREPRVRAVAAQGLARLKHREAIPYLVDGLRSREGKTTDPIIPGAEDALAHFGADALDGILTRLPDGLSRSNGGERWTKALASTVDRQTVSVLLKRTVETHRQVFLQAALQSGLRLTRRELEPAIRACALKYDNRRYHDDVSGWLVDSPAARLAWVRGLLQRWIEKDALYVAPDERFWWTTERLAKRCITIEAISPSKLKQLATKVPNQELGKALADAATNVST